MVGDHMSDFICSGQLQGLQDCMVREVNILTRNPKPNYSLTVSATFLKIIFKKKINSYMGRTRKYRKWQSKNGILTFYVLGFLGHMQFFHLATWKPYHRRPQIGGKDTHFILP